MISFLDFLTEHIITIGYDRSSDDLRQRYKGQISDIIRSSYAKIGGYLSLGSGSEVEDDAIKSDIDNADIIKFVRRPVDHLTAVFLYKKQYGRKSFAAGTDGSEQGKQDFKSILIDDIRQKRAWGEKSGAVEYLSRKYGDPVIKPEMVKTLTGKSLVPDEDGEHYVRNIGGNPHRKIALGYHDDFV